MNAAGVALIVVIAAILGVFVMLVPMGHWTMDEYMVTAAFRDHGLPFLGSRILTWAPRPVSELALFVYAKMVVQYGRPLIGWLLGAYWLAFLATAFVTVHWRSQGLVWRLLAGSALLAMFIVARNPGEVFYWPAGAVAYMGALAGLSMAFFIVADGRDASRLGQAGLVASVIVAAWSSEIGAIFGTCYAGLIFVDRLLGRVRGAGPGARALAGPCIFLAASLAVLGLMITHRGSLVGELPGGSLELMHHPVASLLAALRLFPLDILSESGQTQWSDVVWGDLAHGLLTKLAFVVGFGWCWRSARATGGSRRQLLLFALACLATALLGLTASLYQFGQPCCARHSAFREEVFFLGLAALAILMPLPGGIDVHRPVTTVMAAALLVAAVLVPFAPMIPHLRHDYGLRAQSISATRANFAAAQAPGTEMVFKLRPDHYILPNGELPAGQYVFEPNMPWHAQGILMFFQKKTLTVLPPGR